MEQAPSYPRPVERDSEQLKATTAAVKQMAKMQDHHNTVIHPSWRSQGYPYYRAVWMECAELLDHYGWKWWKDSPRDLDQVKIEIVDIWHFGLSEIIRSDEYRYDVIAKMFISGLEEEGSMTFPEAVEEMASVTLRNKRFLIWNLIYMMRSLPMTFSELHHLYIGKNVLNDFRQNHGYKDGSYRKSWHDGREDNEHLADILRGSRVAGARVDALPTIITEELDTLYAVVS